MRRNLKEMSIEELQSLIISNNKTKWLLSMENSI
jgi:hypothetical protein